MDSNEETRTRLTNNVLWEVKWLLNGMGEDFSLTELDKDIDKLRAAWSELWRFRVTTEGWGWEEKMRENAKGE